MVITKRLWLLGPSSLALMMCVLALSACGGDDDGGGEGVAAPPPNVQTPEPPPVVSSPEEPPVVVVPPQSPPEPEPPVAVNLQGSWESNCQDAADIGLTENHVLTVSDLNVVRVTRISTSGDCKQNAIDITQTATLSIQPEQPAGLFPIDFAVSTLKVKPLNSSGVTILKVAGLCGISSWGIGVEQDVTAATGAERCFPKVPTTIYQVYMVEGNSLFFGNDAGLDLTVVSGRPKDLDRTIIFLKK